MKNLSNDDILAMTVSERLELIERLWESIDESSDDIPLTKDQQLIVDLRLAEDGLDETWEAIRSRILRKVSAVTGA